MARDIAFAQDVWKDEGQNVDFTVLTLNRENREEELKKVRAFIGRFQAIGRSLKIRAIDGQLKMTLGFSRKAWDYLFPEGPRPKELVTFETLKGSAPQTVMPGTEGDIFIHVRSNNSAVVFEAMHQFRMFLKDFTHLEDETKGFRYFEGRAIIGFIDGTEAPIDQEAIDAALVGDDDPEFENGSYVFAQKWVHDMDKWEAKTVEEQEKGIGRSKFNDIELEDEDKYANAHNKASKYEEDGEEKKIIRMNVPFSDPSAGVSGTYFVGYSTSWRITEGMIKNMIELNDYLFTFSKVTTGQLFFVPSLPILDKISNGEM